MAKLTDFMGRLGFCPEKLHRTVIIALATIIVVVVTGQSVNSIRVFSDLYDFMFMRGIGQREIAAGIDRDHSYRIGIAVNDSEVGRLHVPAGDRNFVVHAHRDIEREKVWAAAPVRRKIVAEHHGKALVLLAGENRKWVQRLRCGGAFRFLEAINARRGFLIRFAFSRADWTPDQLSYVANKNGWRVPSITETRNDNDLNYGTIQPEWIAHSKLRKQPWTLLCLYCQRGILGGDRSGISADFANVSLADQINIGKNTGCKQQRGENGDRSINSQLTKVVAFLFFLILPLASFYFVYTGIDRANGFNGWRIGMGIAFFVIAHLYGLYVLLPVLSLSIAPFPGS